MNKTLKVGGALIVAAGFFFIPKYLMDNEDFSSPGTSAVGELLKVPSENVDELDVGVVTTAAEGMPVRDASARSDITLGDYQIEFDSSEQQIHIGSFIDPDRGEDLSEDTAPIHIGEYIDPDRGPDFSERIPIHIGEYMDPDAEGYETSDPKDVIRIGEFIDPDGVGTSATEKRIEIFTQASGVLPE